MINEDLKKIKEAVYGEEVRGSIHDAIKQCYEDATGNPDSVAAAVKKVEELSTAVQDAISRKEYEEKVNAIDKKTGDADAEIESIKTSLSEIQAVTNIKILEKEIAITQEMINEENVVNISKSELGLSADAKPCQAVILGLEFANCYESDNDKEYGTYSIVSDYYASDIEDVGHRNTVVATVRNSPSDFIHITYFPMWSGSDITEADNVRVSIKIAVLLLNAKEENQNESNNQ